MANPVVHFEVVGKDAAALQKFYGEAFDWEISEQMPGSPMSYAMARPRTEDGIDGGIGGGTDATNGHVTFYIAVDDLDAALSKIQSLGGKTVMPPDKVPDGPTIALFSDPEGHVIGLVLPDGE
ncbi:MAG: VOC family protein [Candidatus Tumulicola sp.]